MNFFAFSTGARNANLASSPTKRTKSAALRQRPVETRRRHLETLEIDVLDGEQVRQLVADARAILDVDAFRHVDEDAHQPLGSELPIDQLVPQRGDGLFQQFAQVRHSLRQFGYTDDNR